MPHLKREFVILGPTCSNTFSGLLSRLSSS